jgi:hypothetical protein
LVIFTGPKYSRGVVIKDKLFCCIEDIDDIEKDVDTNVIRANIFLFKIDELKALKKLLFTLLL